MKKALYLLLIVLLISNTIEAKKLHKSKNKTFLLTKEQWPNWVDDFFDWLVSPWRPVWGEFSVTGQNTNAPMALFHSNTFAFD